MEAILAVTPAPSAAALASYEPPALPWRGEPGREEHVVWWAVFVGFAYVLAIAYAAYCTRRGGDPEISLTWRGFKVACHR